LGSIVSIYNELLYRPLFNGLVFLYTALPWQDLGLAIIALTLVIRLILAPILWKAQKAQKDLAKIQPEIKKIQEEHKNNREVQGRAMMELYSKHKVNPFSGCLMLLIQLPILIALFHVFRSGLEPGQLTSLYVFIKNPGILNPVSFGFLDLSRGNIFLGIVAAATQFLQTKMTMPPAPKSSGKQDFASIMQAQALYIFPLLILWWSYTFPAALILYWTALNIFAILQEIIMRQVASRKSQIVLIGDAQQATSNAPWTQKQSKTK
jgi:YidC/Oxa1 family membrane protein insertase